MAELHETETIELMRKQLIEENFVPKLLLNSKQKIVHSYYHYSLYLKQLVRGKETLRRVRSCPNLFHCY